MKTPEQLLKILNDPKAITFSLRNRARMTIQLVSKPSIAIFPAGSGREKQLIENLCLTKAKLIEIIKEQPVRKWFIEEVILIEPVYSQTRIRQTADGKKYEVISHDFVPSVAEEKKVDKSDEQPNRTIPEEVPPPVLPNDTVENTKTEDVISKDEISSEYLNKNFTKAQLVEKYSDLNIDANLKKSEIIDVILGA